MNPADLPVAESAASLRAGRLTSVGLTRAHLDRIASRDGGIGAFVHVAGAEALETARAADDAFADGRDLGPLHGIPFAVKDLIDVAGWPVRHGARARADRIATSTASVVQRLLDGGAVALGLVATYDLGIVGPGDDGAYRQPRNPWNRAHVTGGSSSGSAAAVAAGMVRLAIGTDTGGSVRSPAAYCGAVGLKPTFGRLPRDGVLPLAPSLDHVGLIGRTVDDAARGWTALSGEEVTALRTLDGVRIGYGRGWARDDDAHPDLLPVLDASVGALSLCGARISLVDLPDYALMEGAAAIVLHAEGFARYRAALSDDPRTIGRMAWQSMASGASLTTRDLADALRAGDLLRRRVDAVLDLVDAIVTPVVLTPAPPFAAFEAGPAIWTPMRTIPFDLTGHPALSVPMGFAEGLPLGLQIVGPHGAEASVLRIAAAFEAATDHGAHDPFRSSAPS